MNQERAMSAASQVRELHNADRTVTYQGETNVVNGATVLDGQGKLEASGYQGN